MQLCSPMRCDDEGQAQDNGNGMEIESKSKSQTITRDAMLIETCATAIRINIRQQWHGTSISEEEICIFILQLH